MGSGKTALVSLLPRLYDVSDGCGADRRRRRPLGRPATACGSAIAVVNDDPFLFSATIHDNIAYARPDATREEVERAARGRSGRRVHRARCPRATTRCVGERGLTLSGGQRQRIAIARAMLADPRILILDDATSSVDASTEQEIKLALGERDGGAHDVRDRPPPVDDRARRRDRRARARPGRRRTGRHDELLEQSELYREIVEKGMPDQVFMTRNAPEAAGCERRSDRAPPTPASRPAAAGRKLRGLAELLAPYSWRVLAMFISLVAATAAALAPAPLAKLAIDQGIQQPRRRRARPGRRRCSSSRRSSTASRPTRRRIWSAGSASGRSRTCASSCSPTCSGCRSGSTRAIAPG